MAIGITSFAFRWAISLGNISLFELLVRAQKAGAEVVHVCENLPYLEFNTSEVDRLGKAARDLGLVLEFGTNRSRIEDWKRMIEMAGTLESRLVRLILNETPEKLPVKEIRKNLLEILPLLRDRGLVLAIENHFFFSPMQLSQLLDDLHAPEIGSCLDSLNSISRLAGSEEVLCLLTPRALSAHCKDGIAAPQNVGFYITGCKLGQGMVDLGTMVKTLKKGGRPIHFLYESWMNRLDDPAQTVQQEEEWVRHGISYLRKICG